MSLAGARWPTGFRKAWSPIARASRARSTEWIESIRKILHSYGKVFELPPPREEPRTTPHIAYAISILVYSINKAVIADGVGRRLENFFWRIWSSRKLLHQISGRQLAVQFSHISEGGYFRTTPTQSPRISRSLGSHETGGASDSRAPPSSRDASQPEDRDGRFAVEEEEGRREQEDAGPRMEPAPAPIPKTVTVLPSILKKPKTASTPSSSSSSKTAKVISPDSGLSRRARDDDDGGVLLPANDASAEGPDDRSGSFTRGRQSSSTEEHAAPNIGAERGSRRRTAARESATATEKSIGSQDDVKPKSTGKRTVLAKMGAGKRRPIITQRKSSQSSSGTASHVAASPASGAKNESTARAPGGKPNAERSAPDGGQPIMQRSRQGSPHQSHRSGAVTGDDPIRGESPGNPTNEASAVADGLVDRDFRSRFATRSRVDGPRFGPWTGKSTATAVTCADHQAMGITDSAPSQPSNRSGKWSESFTDETVHLKPPGSSGARAKDDSEARPLPRTKSQLTLLLERDRQRSQDGDHGKEAH